MTDLKALKALCERLAVSTYTDADTIAYELAEAVPALIQEVAALRPLVEAVREWQEARLEVMASEGTRPGRFDVACRALSALALPEEKTK